MTAKTVSIACKEPDYSPQRLDRYLFGHFSDYSRSYFQGLIRKNLVLVNGKIVPKSSYQVQSGDLISFPFVASDPYDTEPQDVDFQVLAEYDDFFIINKPAGLVVHNCLSNKQEVSLVSGLLYRFSEFGNFQDNQRPGIVHRLDKDTSGILIVARNRQAQIAFSQMFKDRTINKSYLAVVDGHPEPKGKVTAMIGRHPVQRYKMFYRQSLCDDQGHEIIKRRSGGKYRGALTYYDVLKFYQDHSLVAAYPVTGRTHQIRVHLASIGHGILGDKMYGKQHEGIARQALHAWKIAFEYKGKQYSFKAPIPDDFSHLLKGLFKQSGCDKVE